MRKPAHANIYDWDAFVKYIEPKGIWPNDDEDEDVEPWWDCWKAGFICAANT